MNQLSQSLEIGLRDAIEAREGANREVEDLGRQMTQNDNEIRLIEDSIKRELAKKRDHDKQIKDLEIDVTSMRQFMTQLEEKVFRIDNENDKQIKELQATIEDESKYEYYEQHFQAALTDVNNLDKKVDLAIDALNSLKIEFEDMDGDL